MATLAYQVRVRGHVQGVFFRAWLQDEANTIRVRGWVRNCTDGTVEAHVEGEEADLSEIIDLMREGPPGATVDRIEVEAADPEGMNSFDICR